MGSAYFVADGWGHSWVGFEDFVAAAVVVEAGVAVGFVGVAVGFVGVVSVADVAAAADASDAVAAADDERVAADFAGTDFAEDVEDAGSAGNGLGWNIAAVDAG